MVAPASASLRSLLNNFNHHAAVFLRHNPIAFSLFQLHAAVFQNPGCHLAHCRGVFGRIVVFNPAVGAVTLAQPRTVCLLYTSPSPRDCS